MKITGDLLKYPVHGDRWEQKAAVGSLLVLIGMLLFPVRWLFSGYSLQVARRTIAGEETGLPEWTDWGGLFADGFKMWVIGFVYNLPFTMLMCVAVLLMLLFIPSMFILPQSPGLGLFGMFAGPALGYVLMGILTLASYPLMFFIQVAITRLAATGEISDAFQIGEVWKLARTGFDSFFVAFLAQLGTLMVLSLGAGIMAATICLWPFTLAVSAYYLGVLTNRAFGLAYREAMVKLAGGAGEALPAGTDHPRPAGGDEPLPDMIS